MAVSVQAPLYSKLGMWVMGDPPTAFSPTDSDAFTTMTYQYSMGTSGLESSSNMIPSHHHLPEEHTQQTSPTDATPLSPSLNNRGVSSSSKSAKIKRSMSTPNVRGQTSADAALALSAEKRRNKLGYHRTSVACGHCRRRKIRCIPAPADPQNRCSNCIRLKKECNFYPVDQQPPPEPRRRGSKAQSGTGRASESSSPSTSSGQLPEMPPTLPYPHLSMPPIQDLGGPQMKKPKTEIFSPENKGAPSRNFDYNNSATNWMAPDASPSTTKTPEIPPSYWRVQAQDSPMTPAFSPFTPGLQIPPPQNWPTSQAEPVQRDELSWSVPQRSMSYGNLESLQSQNQYSAYPHPPQAPPLSDHYPTKARSMHTGMFPPPVSTSSSILPPPEIVSVTSNDGSQHPQSAGPHYPSWQQPYPYQKPTNDSYSSWNSSHGGHPHIPEQGHAPPAGYSYAEAPSSMYYPPPPQGR